MNWEQQRAQILATIKSKKGKVGGIITKASTEKRTTNDDEEVEIKAVEDDIARLETNLKRVEGFIADVLAAAEEATPVAGEDPDEAGASAEGDPEPAKSANKSTSVKDNNAPKGIAFAQYAKAKAQSVRLQKSGSFVTPLEIAKSQGMDQRVITALTKAAAVNTTIGAPLVTPNTIASEFIELLRAQTIVDKLAPNMRSAPFNTTIAGMATGSTAAWVGEGAKKPVSNPTFNEVEIKHHKLAGIVVMTDELMRLSTYSADKMILDDLIESSKELIDNTFLDTSAQSATRPAGVLNGATAVTATGATIDAYNADLKALRAAFIGTKLSLSGAVYVMSETRASDMGELRDALGNPYYRGLQAGLNEKTLNGLPVIESETAPDIIALIKASELYLADDGQVQVDYSDQASIDMGGSTTVNLYQENKFAIRAERYITWAKRRVSAAAYIQYI